MQFEHDGQRTCYEKVSEYMSQLYGESAWRSPDAPYFEVSAGSAFCTVTVAPLKPPHAAVAVYSWVVTEAEDSEAMYRHLLQENGKMVFGAFAVPDPGNILFQHTILGDTLDKEELRASVEAVVFTADDYDDDLINRFGGLRAVDRPPPQALVQGSP